MARVTPERLTHVLELLIEDIKAEHVSIKRARDGMPITRYRDVDEMEFPCVYLDMRVKMSVHSREAFRTPSGDIKLLTCSMSHNSYTDRVQLHFKTNPYTVSLEATSEVIESDVSDGEEYYAQTDPKCAPFRKYMRRRHPEADVWDDINVTIEGPADIDELHGIIDDLQHLRRCSDAPRCKRVFVSRNACARCPTCVLTKGPGRPDAVDDLANTSDAGCTCSICLTSTARYACTVCTAVLHPECFASMACSRASASSAAARASCPQCRTGTMVMQALPSGARTK